MAHPHPSAIRLVFLAPLIFIYPGLLLQFAAAQSEIITITLKSDAATLATSLGSGMPSAKLLDQLDTADIDGLNFERVSVGTFGTVTPIPISAPPDTRIVNIPPGDGQNGFFKVTFELPSNFGEIELTGAANVDDLGRVFVNGDPISPSILSNDPGRITQFGNAVFSISDPLLFRPGENELLISDANTGSGPSGAAFYANITYRKLEPGNISPEVEITAPENGEGFAPGEEITISVEARDRDGAIDHVTFQVGLTQLGIDPDPPIHFPGQEQAEGPMSSRPPRSITKGLPPPLSPWPCAFKLQNRVRGRSCRQWQFLTAAVGNTRIGSGSSMGRTSRGSTTAIMDGCSWNATRRKARGSGRRTSGGFGRAGQSTHFSIVNWTVTGSFTRGRLQTPGGSTT